jgi:hypothetical protein
MNDMDVMLQLIAVSKYLTLIDITCEFTGGSLNPGEVLADNSLTYYKFELDPEMTILTIYSEDSARLMDILHARSNLLIYIVQLRWFDESIITLSLDRFTRLRTLKLLEVTEERLVRETLVSILDHFEKALRSDALEKLKYIVIQFECRIYRAVAALQQHPLNKLCDEKGIEILVRDETRVPAIKMGSSS